MTLDNPFGKRLVGGTTLDEAAGLSVGLIQVECPLLKKPTHCLLPEIGGLFFLCFLLNSVTRAVPQYETQAGQQESDELRPGSPDDRTGSIFFHHRQSLNTMSFLIS